MKIVIAGLGSIGERHAKILLTYTHNEICALRFNGHGNKLGIKEYYNFNDIRSLSPDIAFICNQTSSHISTAIKFAEMGCNLFIEKPIDSSADNLHKLISIVKKKKLVCYIAYNLRFHPVLVKMRRIIEGLEIYHSIIICTSYLPNWRKNKAIKSNYSMHKNKGGGVILDLSHELDYAQYLFGNIENIIGRYNKKSDITVDAEDNADLIIRTKKTDIMMHINFLSNIKQRIIQIDTNRKSFIGDLINSRLDTYKEDSLINSLSFPLEPNHTYIKQIKYFLNNIKNVELMNNIHEASGLLEKILTFKEEY